MMHTIVGGLMSASREERGTEEGLSVEQDRGERARRSRRRVLGWALGLLPAAAMGGWLAREAWGERQSRAGKDAWAARLTRHAAPWRFAGHPSAVSTLNEAIRASASYAPARLMNACLCIDEDQPERVRRELAVSTVRDTPEARLLTELLARRPLASSWRHAFLESWRAVGSPDFSQSPLLPEPFNPLLLVGDPVAAFQIGRAHV